MEGRESPPPPATVGYVQLTPTPSDHAQGASPSLVSPSAGDGQVISPRLSMCAAATCCARSDEKQVPQLVDHTERPPPRTAPPTPAQAPPYAGLAHLQLSRQPSASALLVPLTRSASSPLSGGMAHSNPSAHIPSRLAGSTPGSPVSTPPSPVRPFFPSSSRCALPSACTTTAAAPAARVATFAFSSSAQAQALQLPPAPSHSSATPPPPPPSVPPPAPPSMPYDGAPSPPTVPLAAEAAGPAVPLSAGSPPLPASSLPHAPHTMSLLELEGPPRVAEARLAEIERTLAQQPDGPEKEAAMREAASIRADLATLRALIEQA